MSPVLTESGVPEMNWKIGDEPVRRINTGIMCTALSLLILSSSGCSYTLNDGELREINVGLSSNVVTVDPQMVGDAASAAVVTGYSGTLYRYNSEGELVPDLASSYEVSEDGLTWTFHLYEEAMWSNGDPITADDFVFGVQRIADPATGSGSVYYLTSYCSIVNADDIFNGEADISEIGVYADDPHTVRYELEEPCPYFDTLIASPLFAPCNRSFFYSCNGHYCETSDYMISSGPFIVDRYEPLASQIHFTKNPYYIHSDSVELDGVCLYTINNPQQGYMCFDDGQVDVVTVKGELLDMIGDDSHVRYIPGGCYFFSFNFRNDAINNINIRRALIRAIDRQSIADNVVRSGSIPMLRAVEEGFYSGESTEQYDEQTEEFAELCSYDPEAALEVWNQGMEELGVSSLDLTLAYRNDLGSIIEAVTDEWQRNLPGLHITLRALTREQWLTELGGGDFDMIISSWMPDYSDPMAYLSCFETNINASTPLYSDSEYDGLILSSTDPSVVNDTEARNAVLLEAEMYLAEQAAFVPVVFCGTAIMVSDNVENFSVVPVGISYIFQDMRWEETE